MIKTKQMNSKIAILSPTNLYKIAEKRLNELEQIEKQKYIALQKNLDGKIHVINVKGRAQFYLRIDPKDKSGKYISKKEETTIKRYLQNAYDKKIYRLIQQEIKSIKSFLKHSKNNNLKIQKIYSENLEEVKKYITPIDYSNEDFIKRWKETSFTGNPMPIMTTEYKTDNGEIVRSKSEMNIANALLKEGIPYKYECPLKLYDGRIIYPDFTILDVVNRKLIYWEHRGMMDDREYVKKTVKKMKDYIRSGIVTGNNLIITEETGSSPLGTDEINEVINYLIISL